ncbi:MAG TPA: hypothetical protein VJK05_03660 [archaeon]|nr:hypothetical protein [archaeon]
MAGFLRGLFNKGRTVPDAAKRFLDLQNRRRLAQQAEQLHERSKEEAEKRFTGLLENQKHEAFARQFEKELRFFMISKPFRELNEKQKNDLIYLMAELQISPEGLKKRFNLENINEISHDQLQIALRELAQKLQEKKMREQMQGAHHG